MTEPLELKIERLRTAVWRLKEEERQNPHSPSCKRRTAFAWEAYIAAKKELADETENN